MGRRRKNAVVDPNQPGRSMINIELSQEAQKAVDDSCDRMGMKKRELVARVLRWFAGQDAEIQTLVLGLIPASVAPMVAKQLLENMTGVDSLVGHIEDARKRR